MRISEIEKHLRNFRVGIAGAGGLGSNCAVALARSGIGTLVIADFDSVENENLSRQYFFKDQIGVAKVHAIRENINRINPDINVISYLIRLDEQNIPLIFEGCHLLIEAFDLPEMKEMIVRTVQNKMKGIPLIIGSGLAGWGNNDTIRSRKLDASLYICGDETLEVSEDLPPLAPRVGIVACMQANTAVEILMKMDPLNENNDEDNT